MVTTALARATLRLLPGDTQQVSLFPTPHPNPRLPTPVTTIPSLVKVSRLLAFLLLYRSQLLLYSIASRCFKEGMSDFFVYCPSRKMCSGQVPKGKFWASMLLESLKAPLPLFVPTADI